MITLENDTLVIRFPEIHPAAEARISFQRTLRIPDDGRDYPLPPGMGCFPLHHVEDYAGRLPAAWARRGGVFLPMYQSEALWLNFGRSGYPVALQIAAGKINAINGEPWQEQPQFHPQGYVDASRQPWLDGFCVERGRVRQFVAAPLGQGFSVEEQLTGHAEFGGIQVKAWPLKASAFEALERDTPRFLRVMDDIDVCMSAPYDMGLGMGGSMRQEIYEDRFRPRDWETSATSRCFVNLLNSEAYAQVTGQLPPHRPYSAEDYAAAGLPWFDYYTDQPALEGAAKLQGLKSWKDFQAGKADQPVPIAPGSVVSLGGKKRSGREVSEGQGF